MDTEFAAGAKALTTTQLGNGDLVIEGYAALFDSVDRQDEAFSRGAFTRSVAKTNIPLCWQHRKSVVLGKILSLEERETGLWMRARLDAAIKDDPERRIIFEQVKAGTLSQLSVGGFFRRSGKRIVYADVTEISITPAAVDPSTWFLVTEGKSLGADRLAGVYRARLGLLAARASLLAARASLLAGRR